MFNRKLLIGVTALGLSSVAFANGGGAPAPVPTRTSIPVVVPVQDDGWFIGAEGIFAQPNNPKLSYGIIDPNTDTDPTGKLAQIEPNHHLSFTAGMGYHFAGTGADVSLSYTRIHTDDEDSSSVDEGIIWGRLVHPSASGEYETASANVKFDHDAVDLLFGQNIKVGNHLDVHLGAGVRYAQLNTEFRTSYAADDSQEDETVDVKLISDFFGAGPRITLDNIYKFGPGFGLNASFGGSLLIGRGDLKDSQINHDGDALIYIKKDKTNHVVPELDAKLALSYTYHSNMSGSFSIGLGWQVVNYFNARDAIRFVDDNKEGVYTHNMSDVSFNGPFVGIAMAS